MDGCGKMLHGGGGLSPPWIFASSEIGFDPRNEHDLPVVYISMNQCKRLSQQTKFELCLVNGINI